MALREKRRKSAYHRKKTHKISTNNKDKKSTRNESPHPPAHALTHSRCGRVNPSDICSHISGSMGRDEVNHTNKRSLSLSQSLFRDKVDNSTVMVSLKDMPATSVDNHTADTPVH